jgi:hypothetical protein
VASREKTLVPVLIAIARRVASEKKSAAAEKRVRLQSTVFFKRAGLRKAAVFGNATVSSLPRSLRDRRLSAASSFRTGKQRPGPLFTPMIPIVRDNCHLYNPRGKEKAHCFNVIAVLLRR